MLSHLDVHTLLATLIVGHLVVSLLFIADLGLQRGSRYDRLFLVGKLLQLAGWGLISQRSEISDILSIALGNALLFSGEGCEGLALTSLKAKRMKKWIAMYGILWALFLICFLDLIAVWDLNSKMAFGMPLLAFFYQVPGAYLLFSNRRSSKLQKMMGAMCVIFSAGCVWRFWHILRIEDSYSLFAATVPQTTTFLLLIIMMFSGSMGYILIKKEDATIEIRRVANIDFLTEIYNRRAFFAAAEKFFLAAQQKCQSIALCIVDVDHFKQLNDRHGHLLGDQVLKQVAATLAQHCRKKDTVGRFGGEEFAIVLPDADEELAQTVAEQLRRAVASLKIAELDDKPVTVSVGVAIVDGDAIGHYTLDELVGCSDQALYRAKGNGRNCVVLLKDSAGA